MTHSSRPVTEHRDAAQALLKIALARTCARPLERLAIDAVAMCQEPDAYNGRIIGRDVHTSVPIPLFDNAQMDGYAVCAEDLADATLNTPVELRVDGTVAAGDRVRALDLGTTVAIMTGAPVPVGATAVVPIEVVQPPDWVEHGKSVAFHHAVPTGQFVRAAGSDIEDGGLIVPGGHRLDPASWGALASAGISDVAVVPRPHALLVTTGLELRAPGDIVRPGQIYDANTFSMTRALAEAGCTVEPILCPSDDPTVLRALLDAHVADADFLITVGGVSAGRFEVVKDVLEPAGVTFSHVALQPGGPQGLGIATFGDHELPTFAFPGNPVSALISFELFLRRALRKATGRGPAARAIVSAQLSEAVSSPPGKLQVRRAVLNGQTVHLTGGPSSHLLRAYALANALAFIPADVTSLPAGSTVEVWKIGEPSRSPDQLRDTVVEAIGHQTRHINEDHE